MADKNKKSSSPGAIEMQALAEQAKGLISGRLDPAKLVRVISLLSGKKKAKGGMMRKGRGGSVKKKTTKRK